MFDIRPLTGQELPLAHALSVELFGPSANDKKYQVEQWHEHLRQNGLLLGAFVDGMLIGFKFGYEREPGILHSWLGGVREPYRKQGIAQKLLETQEAWAKEQGYRAITVNTIRTRFPAMYAFLLKNGYQVYEERTADETGSEIKSCFRKQI